MIHVYEVETDADPIWDVFVDTQSDYPEPAVYQESFLDHNDLVTFLDKCTSDGVDYVLYPLADWIY